MDSYRTARFIRITLIIAIIVIVVFGFVSATRYLFFPSDTSTSQADAGKTALLSSSADRSVRMNVRGDIVADEDFRSYQMIITPNERIYIAYKGYMNQQIDKVSLVNNIPAYEQFIYALYGADFMKGNELTGDSNELRGVCASGKLYEFQILKSEKVIKKLWTTSCSGLRGSLKASLTQINSLFNDQIPDVQSNIGKLWR